MGALFALSACGDDDGGVDASMDAGADAPSFDSSFDSSIDAPDIDAASDAGSDGGDLDAGGMDSGTDDAAIDAPAESDGIAEVREAAVGTHVPTLAVRGVTVTYVRAAIGDDPAGFFVQADAMGPALFVADDSASPSPEAGDVVDFDVTETELVDGMLHVVGIAGYTRESTGADVSALVQDLSDADDVISAVGDYESELVAIAGTISAVPIGGGNAHFVAPFRTTAIDDMDLLLRLPETLYFDNELREGCTLTATAPLWRFNDSAQAQPLVDADLSGVSCPTLEGTAPGAGDLVVTEIFFDDGVVGPDGPFEWVEVYNPTDTELQMYACELDDDPSAGANARAVTESILIGPRSYAVFGGAMSEASPVTEFGPALNNSGGDSVEIRCGGVVVDHVDYASGTAGSSLQLDPRSTTAALNDDVSNWCVSATGYGTMGFFGTPNDDNPTCSTTAELMITEYVEGSSQNKAVEISNVGGASFANLASCTLHLYANGAVTPNNSFTYPAGALAPGESFVVCNSGAVAGLMASCDATDPVTFFNGNDALVLDCGGVVDVLGQVGFDPGTAWSAGGVSTLNQTIRRACTARADTDGSDAFDPSAEWESFSIDTFGDVGSAPSCP